jgi:murein DD-endopeptidase MepM/ murein hydrolase activator NlpD
VSEIIQLISPPDRDAQTDFPTIAFRSAVPDPVVAQADVDADRNRRGEKAGVARTLVESYSHEILHTHTRHVTRGDPVVEGQLIGTMGNMGVVSEGVESGDHHAHFQIKDSSGNRVNPTAY